MKYSVVTIGYKSFNNILSRVNEAFNSTLKPAEFIVIVNPYGNESETKKIVDFARNDSRITRWVYCSQNIGCATAFNLGLAISDTDYIVCLSDDCGVGSITYQKMIESFKDELVGVVGVEKGGFPGEPMTPKGFLVAYRKKMVQDIGGYSEISTPLADEREFGMRAIYNGWKVNVPEGCEYIHVHDVSSNPNRPFMYLNKTVVPQGPNGFQPEQVKRLKKKIDTYL